ncbi:MAG: hypothetical protein GY874_04740 [Desulfobacteraceae bacterium]|nr:hypothetical protein [Desulfobacteraceae bacterium]
MIKDLLIFLLQGAMFKMNSAQASHSQSPHKNSSDNSLSTGLQSELNNLSNNNINNPQARARIIPKNNFDQENWENKLQKLSNIKANSLNLEKPADKNKDLLNKLIKKDEYNWVDKEAWEKISNNIYSIQSPNKQIKAIQEFENTLKRINEARVYGHSGSPIEYLLGDKWDNLATSHDALRRFNKATKNLKLDDDVLRQLLPNLVKIKFPEKWMSMIAAMACESFGSNKQLIEMFKVFIGTNTKRMTPDEIAKNDSNIKKALMDNFLSSLGLENHLDDVMNDIEKNAVPLSYITRLGVLQKACAKYLGDSFFEVAVKQLLKKTNKDCFIINRELMKFNWQIKKEKKLELLKTTKNESFSIYKTENTKKFLSEIDQYLDILNEIKNIGKNIGTFPKVKNIGKNIGTFPKGVKNRITNIEKQLNFSQRKKEPKVSNIENELNRLDKLCSSIEKFCSNYKNKQLPEEFKTDKQAAENLEKSKRAAEELEKKTNDLKKIGSDLLSTFNKNKNVFSNLEKNREKPFEVDRFYMSLASPSFSSLFMGDFVQCCLATDAGRADILERLSHPAFVIPTIQNKSGQPIALAWGFLGYDKVSGERAFVVNFMEMSTDYAEEDKKGKWCREKLFTSLVQFCCEIGNNAGIATVARDMTYGYMFENGTNYNQNSKTVGCNLQLPGGEYPTGKKHKVYLNAIDTARSQERIFLLNGKWPDTISEEKIQKFIKNDSWDSLFNIALCQPETKISRTNKPLVLELLAKKPKEFMRFAIMINQKVDWTHMRSLIISAEWKDIRNKITDRNCVATLDEFELASVWHDASATDDDREKALRKYPNANLYSNYMSENLIAKLLPYLFSTETVYDSGNGNIKTHSDFCLEFERLTMETKQILLHEALRQLLQKPFNKNNLNLVTNLKNRIDPSEKDFLSLIDQVIKEDKNINIVDIAGNHQMHESVLEALLATESSDKVVSALLTNPKIKDHALQHARISAKLQRVELEKGDEKRLALLTSNKFRERSFNIELKLRYHDNKTVSQAYLSNHFRYAQNRKLVSYKKLLKEENYILKPEQFYKIWNEVVSTESLYYGKLDEKYLELFKLAMDNLSKNVANENIILNRKTVEAWVEAFSNWDQEKYQQSDTRAQAFLNLLNLMMNYSNADKSKIYNKKPFQDQRPDIHAVLTYLANEKTRFSELSNEKITYSEKVELVCFAAKIAEQFCYGFQDDLGEKNASDYVRIFQKQAQIIINKEKLNKFEINGLCKSNNPQVRLALAHSNKNEHIQTLAETERRLEKPDLKVLETIYKNSHWKFLSARSQWDIIKKLLDTNTISIADSNVVKHIKDIPLDNRYINNYAVKKINENTDIILTPELMESYWDFYKNNQTKIFEKLKRNIEMDKIKADSNFAIKWADKICEMDKKNNPASMETMAALLDLVIEKNRISNDDAHILLTSCLPAKHLIEKIEELCTKAQLDNDASISWIHDMSYYLSPHSGVKEQIQSKYEYCYQEIKFDTDSDASDDGQFDHESESSSSSLAGMRIADNSDNPGSDSDSLDSDSDSSSS